MLLFCLFCLILFGLLFVSVLLLLFCADLCVGLFVFCCFLFCLVLSLLCVCVCTHARARACVSQCACVYARVCAHATLYVCVCMHASACVYVWFISIFVWPILLFILLFFFA